MPITDIQVYVDNDTACGTRIENAVNLAMQFEARLEGLYSVRKVTVPAGIGAPASMGFYEAVDRKSADQIEQAKNIFESNAAMVSGGGQFQTLDGYLIDDLSVQSRYADLLVIPQDLGAEANLNSNYWPGSVLMTAACPVLLLPDSKSINLPPQTALLAWDGSRESANALRAAWPMLERVEKIDIASVASNDAEAMDIAKYIGHHGVECEIHLLEGSEWNAGGILLEQADALGSQLIIMGAYGHSRLREFVLGGTTRHMLNHAKLPVLFSH
jgi:nucleotide-binding universal stress UspA family protein